MAALALTSVAVWDRAASTKVFSSLWVSGGSSKRGRRLRMRCLESRLYYNIALIVAFSNKQRDFAFRINGAFRIQNKNVTKCLFTRGTVGGGVLDIKAHVVQLALQKYA